MSNRITAFFKGRVGVAEAVYQNDYGIVMNLDSIELPAHFDCYFSTLAQDEAIPGIGADNQVVIPNDCLSRSGNVTLHIPLHTGANDSEVEYIVYFKVIGRARPIDDGTPVQMTAIEQALALLQNPIGNIEQIVNEALAFTGDTFAEMQAQLDADLAAYETSMGQRADAFEAEIRSDIADVESDFDNLNAQYQTAVAAHTVDSEVQNIRVGADNVTYTSAGESVRTQFTNLKSEISDIASTFTVLAPYLYKKNKYINDSGVETNLNGYDLYKIPLNDYDIISFKWDTAFWGSLGTGYVFSLEDTHGTVTSVGAMSVDEFLLFNSTRKEMLMLNNSDYVALYVSAQAGSEDNAIIAINSPFAEINNPNTSAKGVHLLTDAIAIKSNYYLRYASQSTVAIWTSGYYSYFVPVKAGDKIGFIDSAPSGLSYRGRVRYNDGSETYIGNVSSHEFTADGIADLWLADSSESPVFYPDDSIKIEAKNVISDTTSDNDIAEVKIDSIASNYTILAPYFYKANVYLDDAGNEISLSGFNLYKIPWDSFVQIKWSENFVGGLAWGLVFHGVKTDDSIESLTNTNLLAEYRIGASVDWGESAFRGNETYKAILISVQAGKEDCVKVYRNSTKPILEAEIPTGVEMLDESNSIKSIMYLRVDGLFSNFYGTANYYALYRKVKAGDKVLFSGTVTGLSYSGLFIDSDNTPTSIGISAIEYTAPSDGLLMLFINTTMTRSYTFCPADSIKIEGKNIVNFTGGDTQFQGKSGVAFGTSLTYRSIISSGYLTKLAELSGITFDNQGIGSSVIKGNMLTAIKSYSSYADKDVCLLEGFVNDWYTNLPLGTWKDTTEDTVCGCVRVALDYMISQNANMTVFLILDHYGRNVSNVDCSTLATNGSGLTQFEYYSEIAKVAESMGIPVIREFEDSQISENTPQYLADNIHLNALGAVQSGTVIWYQMKQYSVNV